MRDLDGINLAHVGHKLNASVYTAVNILVQQNLGYFLTRRKTS
jgi:hypothetical protein